MYRVLIPTDFSENAFRALNYGSIIFAGLSCTFYLLHVYTPTIRSSRFMASDTRGLNASGNGREAALKNLAATRGRIQRKNQFPDHHYQILTSFNLLTEEIEEVASTLDLDLILMSTRGASDRDEIFMGGNGVRVIQKIRHFPILLLPPGFPTNKSKMGILTTNLQRACLPSDLRNLSGKFGPVFGHNAEHLLPLPNNSRNILLRSLQRPVITRQEFTIELPILFLPEVTTQPKAFAFF